eukprot:Skav203218  [mRNA]  locus=scaffold2292:61264:63525:+ [translate_table: standard]
MNVDMRAKVVTGTQEADNDEPEVAAQATETSEYESKKEKLEEPSAEEPSCPKENPEVEVPDPQNEPVQKEEQEKESFDKKEASQTDGFEEGRRSRKSASRRLQQQLQAQQEAPTVPPSPAKSQNGHSEAPAQQVPKAKPSQVPKLERAVSQGNAEAKAKARPKAGTAGTAGTKPVSVAATAEEPPVKEEDDMPRRAASQPNMENGHGKMPKAKEQVKERLQRLEEDARQAASRSESGPGEGATAENQMEAPKPEKRERRAWSEVVAPWAKRTEAGMRLRCSIGCVASSFSLCSASQVKSNLGAGAPEFVPLAQQLQELGVERGDGTDE